MATIEPVQPDSVASSAHQNGLIEQVNTNTGDLNGHENRISTLETYGAAGSFMGQWIDDGAGVTQGFRNSTGHKVVGFTEPVVTPSGCSISDGTVTVSQSGLWLFTASAQYTGSASVRALWLSKSANASGSNLAKYGSIAGPSMDVQTVTSVFRLSAGEQISAYVAIWQNDAPIALFESNSCMMTAVWIGP